MTQRAEDPLIARVASRLVQEAAGTGEDGRDRPRGAPRTPRCLSPRNSIATWHHAQSVRLPSANYRIHREQSVELDPSCTVIGGPNESGKSTLAEAAHRALFLKARIMGEALLAMKSTVHPGHPEVAVRFETGGKSYSIQKRFSGRTGDRRAHGDGRTDMAGRRGRGQVGRNCCRSRTWRVGEAPVNASTYNGATSGSGRARPGIIRSDTPTRNEITAPHPPGHRRARPCSSRCSTRELRADSALSRRDLHEAGRTQEG